MNKSLATLAAVLIGLAVLFSFLDKPDDVPQPPEPKANIAAQARASAVAFAWRFGGTAGEAADKLNAGEFRKPDGTLDADALWKFIAQSNEKGRKESFKDWGAMMDEKLKTGDVKQVEVALRETHTGAGKVK